MSVLGGSYYMNGPNGTGYYPGQSGASLDTSGASNSMQNPYAWLYQNPGIGGPPPGSAATAAGAPPGGFPPPASGGTMPVSGGLGGGSSSGYGPYGPTAGTGASPYDFSVSDYLPDVQGMLQFAQGVSHPAIDWGAGGYGGGGYGGQSPAQLGAIAAGMQAAAGAQGQIGAAQAGAQGQIGAAQAAADAAKLASQLGLQGTQNTNQTNQAIAGIGQATQLGLGQLGLAGQLGTSQNQLTGVQTTAEDQLQAAIRAAQAQEAVANTQSAAQQAIAHTQNEPALAKLDLAKQLFGMGGAGGAGGAAGGILGSTPLGSGVAQNGQIGGISSPTVPQFSPLSDIARQRMLGQQDAQINSGYDTLNNAMAQDMASRGFSTAGPGYAGLQSQNEQRRLGDLTTAGLNTDMNFAQYNAQNALPYSQLALQNYNASADRALQAQLANLGFVGSFLS